MNIPAKPPSVNVTVFKAMVEMALTGTIFNVVTEPDNGVMTTLSEFAREKGIKLVVIYADIMAMNDWGPAMMDFVNVITVIVYADYDRRRFFNRAINVTVDPDPLIM